MSHKCGSCEKEFESYESMKQHSDAAHGGAQQQATNQQQKSIRIPWYVPVLVVIIIAIAAFVILRPETSSSPGASGASAEPTIPAGQPANYWTEQFPFGTDPNLHWHAYPKFKFCGEDKTMLQILDMAGKKFANGMIGPHVMHVHDSEPWFHIESPPPTRKSITLGAGFKAINVPFSNTGILNYQGASGCNNTLNLTQVQSLENASGVFHNQTNSLKVSVNGKPVVDPASYVMQDNDKIIIDYS